MCLYEECYLCVGTHGDQKRPLDPLELKLQVAVLGTKLRSSVRIVCTLNC